MLKYSYQNTKNQICDITIYVLLYQHSYIARYSRVSNNYHNLKIVMSMINILPVRNHSNAVYACL